MWILTQNGKRILSTEGLDEIAVGEPAEGKTDYAVMLRRRTDGKPFALGFYAKRERAAMVLKEILKAQSHFYSCQGGVDLVSGSFQPGYVAIPPKVYEMPPDADEAFVREVRMEKGCTYEG